MIMLCKYPNWDGPRTPIHTTLIPISTRNTKYVSSVCNHYKSTIKSKNLFNMRNILITLINLFSLTISSLSRRSILGDIELEIYPSLKLTFEESFNITVDDVCLDFMLRLKLWLRMILRISFWKI
jgi:hypothetical protein